MKGPNIARPMVFGLLIGIGCAAVSWSSQQAARPGTVSVSMVVSVEAKHGKDIPTIYREDVRVFQGQNRIPVTDWVSLQGDKGELKLYVLLDDALNPTIGLQFDDLRQFMKAQPATTAIAVGYMRNGMVETIGNFTKDHAQAAQTLRLPLGSPGVSASPYLSISDLIKRWPQGPARHEILMVSDGIDRLQGGPNDPYLQEAIEQAQRAGVQIYTIYAAGAGHYGHSFWRLNWGQINLSQLADETGGEAYFQGFQTPVAFAPYLEEFSLRLRHQYKLTFLAKTEKKASYQRVRLETEVPNAELVAADRVYVPAAR